MSYNLLTMNLQATKTPLTVKDFEEQSVGFCAGCGCACGYILYKKGGKIVDLYGHPADPRGMGSFCTKGITYIQEIPNNPMRLKGIFLRKGEEFMPLGYAQALELLKDRLQRGKTAFLLGRQTGFEEYAIARSLSEDVFVDAPLVDFMPSTLGPTDWKRARFILSVDAEPVFSEVMAMRWVVDAIEAGAYLFCLSSRYETMCAKARERMLLKPDAMMQFLQDLLEPDRGDNKVDFVKKSLFLIRGSLLLVGAHLLNSPFRRVLIALLSGLRRRFGVNYSLVGDVMPFPAKPLEEFFNRFDDFENLVVVGNLFRYFKEDQLKALGEKFVLSFQVFPNITAHYSDLIFALSIFPERDFINYRHGFGNLVYSQKTLNAEDVYNPAEVLKETFKIDTNLAELLREYGVNYEKLRVEGEATLMMEDIGSKVEIQNYKIQAGELFLYTDSTLVEDLGHWNPWTHEMDRVQRAYVNPHTARKLGLKQSIELEGLSFELLTTENVAEGIVFIPSEYEEFQPFDPGHRVGAFAQNPFYRYEVLS